MDISEGKRLIHKAILRGLLLEPSLIPSLGLVTPRSMGSHEDMNYISFLLGSSSIASYIDELINLGFKYKSRELFEEARKIGKLMEEDLFKDLYGVNTQKGLIFLVCLLAPAAGRILKEEKKLELDLILDEIARITKGLVERDLVLANRGLTNGEKLYRKYALGGIRKEVEEGLPSIRKYAFIELEEKLKYHSLNDSLLHTLIVLMSQVEDTTLVHRGGIKALEEVRAFSREIIRLGSIDTCEGLEKIDKLDKFMLESNLSPGGSADLLAITISLYFIKHGRLNEKSILSDNKLYNDATYNIIEDRGE